ncbi:hypothetical protein VNO80_26325 [Phaseolus coccineus]|uniref:Uncharacterized protein n=1 Tax=Phaseolus coccineus TaxID=3886 RepID=A0AAN9QE99_PHACN
MGATTGTTSGTGAGGELTESRAGGKYVARVWGLVGVQSLKRYGRALRDRGNAKRAKKDTNTILYSIGS